MAKAALKSTTAMPAEPTVPAESQNVDNVTKLKSAKGKGKSVHTFKPGIVYQIPWRDLQVEPGYNVRTFNPDIESHAALAQSIRLLGVQTPLTIRLVKGKPTVVAGHLRRGACEWLARDGGKRGKHMVPSVPVLLREDMDDDGNRVADLAVSQSHTRLTPLQQAETAARMDAKGYGTPAIAAHLGGISTKWVKELIKLHELRTTAPALADMVVAVPPRIFASTALQLVQTHGAKTAASLAIAVYDREASKAKFGGPEPRVTTGKVNTYLAELAKATPDVNTRKPAEGEGEGEESAREPVSELAKAQAVVAAAKAELSLAEARRKGAKGNSVKKAQRELEGAMAALTAAEAEVVRLTPAPIEVEAHKRGPTKRTGANAEKDASNGATERKPGPLAFTRAPDSKIIAYATGTRQGKVAVTATHATLAAWVESLMNENADTMPVLN